MSGDSGKSRTWVTLGGRSLGALLGACLTWHQDVSIPAQPLLPAAPWTEVCLFPHTCFLLHEWWADPACRLGRAGSGIAPPGGGRAVHAGRHLSLICLALECAHRCVDTATPPPPSSFLLIPERTHPCPSPYSIRLTVDGRSRERCLMCSQKAGASYLQTGFQRARDSEAPCCPPGTPRVWGTLPVLPPFWHLHGLPVALRLGACDSSVFGFLG